MPKSWSIPRTSYDALAKLSLQRSPAIDRAIWAAQSDPARIIRAMEERLTQALATATAKVAALTPATATAKVAASPPATAKEAACAAAEAGTTAKEAGTKAKEEALSSPEEQASVLHQRTVPGTKLVNGDEYVRVSVCYPPRTATAVEYLSGLFKLSYEETVRLSLEAYIKHL